MGGVRNGKNAGTPESPASQHEALRPGVPDVGPEEDAQVAVDRHLRSAMGLLREGSAARAFGQLARASRSEVMTPRLAAALVRFALLAGTEAAAITLLDATQGKTSEARLAVHRQLARVLRRVGQLPRAMAALEAVLAQAPDDRRARRVLQVLKERDAWVRGGGTEAPGKSAGEPAPASSVLGKLPTRKAGVQAIAVWDEDSDYREDTLVESASGGPAESSPPEPREKTAVAFPAVDSSEPREKTAVAFPAVDSSEPREKMAVAFPSADSSEPREKTAVAFPAVAASEPRSKTEVELPAVVLAPSPPPPSESRSKTEVELPAVVLAPSPPPESRPTVVEMPAIVLPPSAPTVEPRKSAAPPAPSTVLPEARTGRTAGQHLSVPWPEPSPEDDEAPPPAAPPPVAPPPLVKDPRTPPVRAGAWSEDEATGEVTSEAPPFPPDDEPRGLLSRTKSQGTEAPRADVPSAATVERTQAPVVADKTRPAPGSATVERTQAPDVADKARPAPASMSPAATQQVSVADLQAALSGAAPSRADGAGTPAPGASAGGTPTARADGTDAQAAGAGRAPGARPDLKPEDAEELARSQKLEAQLIARQAWRELAQLYLKRADRAKDASVRAEALTRLAEVMETELQDPAGAARMYREIVDLTGDRAALREQVRLLSTRGDASLVRRALDEAIQRARSARARAGALLTRGERWLHMGEPAR
ncbi:tetratricopeptide repeat protein, partial [Pyxidicoccus sp. 3LFB2]